MRHLRGVVHDALMHWRPWYRGPVLGALEFVRLREPALSNGHVRRLLLRPDDPAFARILDTRPQPASVASDLELHMLLCEGDVFRSLWALKSFFHGSGLDARLVVHDDGTLSEASRETLRAHFPGCEIPDHAPARMAEALARHPMCRFFRSKHPIAGKILDVLVFARSRYVIVMDSDVLWFRTSPEVDACVAAGLPFHMSSGGDAYARDARFMEEELDLHPAHGVNCGIVGFLRTEFLDLDFLETALDRMVNVSPGRLPAALGFGHDRPLPTFDPDDPVESILWWVMEQTLYALLIGRNDRRVALRRGGRPREISHEFGITPVRPTTALQHFISDARWNAFFPLGAHHLIRSGFLEAWRPSGTSPALLAPGTAERS